MTEESKIARKNYIKLLKYCNSNVDEWPDNLLQLLNDAHREWHKLMNL